MDRCEWNCRWVSFLLSFVLANGDNIGLVVATDLLFRAFSSLSHPRLSFLLVCLICRLANGSFTRSLRTQDATIHSLQVAGGNPGSCLRTPIISFLDKMDHPTTLRASYTLLFSLVSICGLGPVTDLSMGGILNNKSLWSGISALAVGRVGIASTQGLK
jgi:hypothetical protein